MPQEILRPPHQIPVNHVASRLPRPPHARLPLPQRPQLFRVFPLRPRSLQRHLPSFPVKLRDSRPRHQRSRARSSRSIPPQRRRSRVRLPSSSRHVRPPAPRQPRDRRARHRLFDRFRRVSPRRPDVRVVVHRVARHARGRSRSTRFDSIRSPTVVRVDSARFRARAPSDALDRPPSIARATRSIESRDRAARDARCAGVGARRATPTIDRPPRARRRSTRNTRGSARPRCLGGNLSSFYLVRDRIRARRRGCAIVGFSAIGAFMAQWLRRPLRKGKIASSTLAESIS